MFEPDKPISTPKQDILNRKKFAQAVAKALRSWNESTSLVAALYGDWGSGKSSVKNMIWQYLLDEPKTCPSVIEFNPWIYSSTEALADAFFREISVAIGKTGDIDSAEKASRLLLYGKMAAAGSRIIRYAKELMPLPIISTLAEKGLSSLGEEFRGCGELLQAEIEAGNKTLLELKKEIMVDLGNLPKPILVFIDDIDRLTVEETRLLFQLIKANADFPNLVYFLMFQRDIVEKSLDVPGKIDGKVFLEKIVQVGFSLPAIHNQDLQAYLFERLDQLVASRGIAQHFDRKIWQLLYKKGLSFYFNNLRNVQRFLNTYNFHLGLFSGEADYPINPLDLLVVEIYRLFNEDLYRKIYSMRSTIMDTSEHRESYIRTGIQNRGGEVLQKANAPAVLHEKQVVVGTEQEKDAFVSALNYLFRADDQSEFYRKSADNKAVKRLKEGEYFDRYFHFVVEPQAAGQESSHPS